MPDEFLPEEKNLMPVIRLGFSNSFQQEKASTAADAF
jgi:hypothetical protein